MAYGSFVLMRDLNFTDQRWRCVYHHGRQRERQEHLAKTLIGLNEPAQGRNFLRRENFTKADPSQTAGDPQTHGRAFSERRALELDDPGGKHRFALEEYTDLNPHEIREIASLKLALVGLKGFEDYYPSQISGGMQKRAGLARAMALDPGDTFFRRTFGRPRSD